MASQNRLLRFFGGGTKELRSDSAITNTTPWLIDTFGSLIARYTQSGQEVNVQSAMSIASVKRCVQAISDGMIGLNLRVYDQRDGTKKVASNYFASILMDQPNQYQNKSEWMSFMVAVCELKGNSYSRIIRNSSYLATELHPLNSDYTTPFIKEGKLKYKTLWNGIQIELDSTDVIHFKNICDENPYAAKSPITRHAEVFGVNLAARSYTAGVYKNGVLKFLLKAPGMIKEDQRMSVQQSLNDTINGKSGNVVLPDGISIEKLSLTLQDAQIVETMQLSREDIAQIFGVPISMIQPSNGRGSLEQEWQDFYSSTLMGKAVRYEQELTRKLVAEKDKGSVYFKFQFNSLLRATAQDRAEFYNKGINNGWIKPNEARLLEDLSEYEGGDNLFVNANLIPVDKMNDWIDGKINALESQAMKNNNPTGNNNNINN